MTEWTVTLTARRTRLGAVREGGVVACERNALKRRNQRGFLNSRTDGGSQTLMQNANRYTTALMFRKYAPNVDLRVREQHGVAELVSMYKKESVDSAAVQRDQKS